MNNRTLAWFVSNYTEDFVRQATIVLSHLYNRAEVAHRKLPLSLDDYKNHVILEDTFYANTEPVSPVDFAWGAYEYNMATTPVLQLVEPIAEPPKEEDSLTLNWYRTEYPNLYPQILRRLKSKLRGTGEDADDVLANYNAKALKNKAFDKHIKAGKKVYVSLVVNFAWREHLNATQKGGQDAHCRARGKKSKQEVTSGETQSQHRYDSYDQAIVSDDNGNISSVVVSKGETPEEIYMDREELESRESYRSLLLAINTMEGTYKGAFNAEVLNAIMEDQSDSELAQVIDRSEDRARTLKYKMRQDLKKVGLEHQNQMEVLAALKAGNDITTRNVSKEIVEDLISAGLIRASGVSTLVLTQRGLEAYLGSDYSDLTTLIPVKIAEAKRKIA